MRESWDHFPHSEAQATYYTVRADAPNDHQATCDETDAQTLPVVLNSAILRMLPSLVTDQAPAIIEVQKRSRLDETNPEGGWNA